MYRISTWNVERPKPSSRKSKLVIQKILELNSDIIVLTESSTAIDLSELYPYCAKTKPFDLTPTEHWVEIWSKWPITESFKTVDVCRTVAAKIQMPFGHINIYGTIIPYHMAGVIGKRYSKSGYKVWQYHEEDILDQSRNWQQILAQNPTVPLVIVGDFNQTRGIGKGYGTEKCRKLLTNELKKIKAECISEGSFENNFLTSDPRKGTIRKNIDHICVSTDFFSTLNYYKVSAWNQFNEAGIFMSDHNGVYADFEL